MDEWIPYLQSSRLITVRSRTCQQIVNRLLGRNAAQFYPDLAYLFHPIPTGVAQQKRLVGLVPAGDVRPDNRFVQALIAPFLSTGHEMYVMNMGAEADGIAHMRRAARHYPHAERIPSADPYTAYLQIKKSSFLVTGRYHGLVFARSCGVPFFRSSRAHYKLCEEDIFTDTRSAIEHIHTLQDSLVRIA